ncbi:MAG: hypothetical protein ACK4PR_01640 [Gammaproteobacteria bacterium]
MDINALSLHGTPKSAPSKDLLFTPHFNNQLWRDILAHTASLLSEELNIKIEVISPFGFEVTQNPHFLTTQLRRFYCYIGMEKYSTYNKEFVATRFYEHLFDYLSVLNTAFLDNIAIVIFNQHIHLLNDHQYHCQPQDCLIDIQVREINHDIITDYGNYLIASLAGLYEHKIESMYFYEDIRYRWRTYQLFVIHEHLFGHLLPPMTEEHSRQFKRLFSFVSNSINIFYHSAGLHTFANSEEIALYRNLIQPRITSMIHAIRADDKDNITLSIPAYHFDDVLTIEIDHLLYEKTLDFIKNSYQQFV